MFNRIIKFEQDLASFFKCGHVVLTDSCTHAIELCLIYTGTTSTTCPKYTYISIPMTFEKLKINWTWEDNEWENYYYLGNTNIIDAAVFWSQSGYIKNTFMCLSFQYRKHLSLGRGGAILCDSFTDYQNLKKLSYDGRNFDIPWRQQDITSLGYHYYMTPETAEEGSKKLKQIKYKDCQKWSWKDYPNLSNMTVFKNKL